MGIIGKWIATGSRAAEPDSGDEFQRLDRELARALTADDMLAVDEILARLTKATARKYGTAHPTTLELYVVRVSTRATLQLPSVGPEARSLFRDCVKILEAHHELTFNCRVVLATIARTAGRYLDAERELRSVVADIAPHFGTASPLLLRARTELAAVLVDSGRYAEAVREAEAVLELTGTKAVERNSLVPDLLNTRAYALHRLGRNAHAEADMIRCHEILGGWRLSDQPEFRMASAPILATHARVEAALGHPKSGEALARQAVEALAEVRGIEEHHTLALAARIIQATCLLALGRVAEADAIAVRASELSWHHLGPEHRLSLESRSVRADCLRALGHADVAAAEHTVVHEVLHRTLGPDHPDTIAARAKV